MSQTLQEPSRPVLTDWAMPGAAPPVTSAPAAPEQILTLEGARPTFAAGLHRAPFRAIGLVLIVALAAYMLDSLGGGLIFRARQGQLASDYRTPRNYTARGRALAIVQIPKINLNLVVAEGVDPPNLRGGPGHLPSSAVPGAPGNSVLMGHRDRFGGPFHKLGQLVVGDDVYIQPKGSADVVQYKVTKLTRGGESLVSALAPSDDIHLTLVTSSGSRISSDRLVVEAVAETAARKVPLPTAAIAAPGSIEPSGHPFNVSAMLAVGWAALGLLLFLGLRRAMPDRVRFLVAAMPLILAATMFWLEFDRWLPATI